MFRVSPAIKNPLFMKQITIPRGCIIVTEQTMTGKTSMAKAYAKKYPDTVFIVDDDMLQMWTPNIRKKIFEKNKGKKIVIITEDPSLYKTEEPTEPCSGVKGQDWTYCEVNESTECPGCCCCDKEDYCVEDFSFGWKAVGLHQLSPYCDPEIREIKECYADIIDHLNDARDAQREYERKRLYSVAITEAETACMWAVKALTFNI